MIKDATSHVHGFTSFQISAKCRRRSECFALCGGLPDAQADTFSHQQVIDQARELASQDYLPPLQVAPACWISTMTRIARSGFRKDKALWSKTSSLFEAEFLHREAISPGVELFSVESGTAHVIGVDQTVSTPQHLTSLNFCKKAARWPVIACTS
ncbi:MAG: glucan biosynthesis protein [Hahellaceae bacterium]|nr:glucan biosynthesis protein [Hahellaceae bacterium]